MSIFNFISLFGGLALFLYGMRQMGDGLREGTSASFKKVMEKLTNNPVMGFLVGMILTAVIQSSTATIVITSSLVGAGIISLSQSIGIIIGANVGTTMTGQIIRLMDINADANSWINIFKPDTLAPVASVIGIIVIMAFKSKNSGTIGKIAIGFGILFTGLMNMTAAVQPLAESETFANLFIELADKPMLGFFAGLLVAFSIQSSSATIGILQALSVTGALSFASVYPIIIGIYFGDCFTTAIVCSIGAKADAKRTGLIHILFNFSEAILVTIGVNLVRSIGLLDNFWATPITSGGIANTHTIFNLACAVIILPFCGIFAKLSKKLIKDDKEEASEFNEDLKVLDPMFYKSPVLALNNSYKLISSMADIAYYSTMDSFDLLNDFDGGLLTKLDKDEDKMDAFADSVSDYLAKLAPFAGSDNNRIITYYLQCITDLERIGDHSQNITEVAAHLSEIKEHFNADMEKEIQVLKSATDHVLSLTLSAFNKQNLEAARLIQPVAEVVDGLTIKFKDNHLKRIKDGHSNVEVGFDYMDLLSNISRISDQCSNIGLHTISRHDPKIENYEHEYVIRLHSGENEEYNHALSKWKDYYESQIEA